MGKISDLIRTAADKTVPLSVVLNAVNIVAHDLELSNLIAWLEQEEHGYASRNECPVYRFVDYSAEAKSEAFDTPSAVPVAYFYPPTYIRTSGAPVRLPNPEYDGLSILNGVKDIEDWISNLDGGFFKFPVSDYQVLLLNDHMCHKGFNPVPLRYTEAKFCIRRSDLEKLLKQVRDSLKDRLKEVRRHHPELALDPAPLQTTHGKAGSNTVVNAPKPLILLLNEAVLNINQNVNPLHEVMEFVRAAGFADDQVNRLREAIIWDAEHPETLSEGIGEKTWKFMREFPAKVAQGFAVDTFKKLSAKAIRILIEQAG